MSLVETNGGLLVPEGALEAAVSAALKRHDPELRLVPQDSDVYGRRIYKVYRYMGSDTPAAFVCGWWNDRLEPLPLSMALLDMVQLYDLNTVGRVDDEQVLEQKLRDERRQDYLRDAEAIVKEFGPKLDGKSMSPLPRSRGLQLARQRERARITDPDLRP